MRQELHEWWFSLFGVKYKNNATYKTIESKLDEIADTLESKDKRIAELEAVLKLKDEKYNALDKSMSKINDGLRRTIDNFHGLLADGADAFKLKSQQMAEMEATIETLRGMACKK